MIRRLILGPCLLILITSIGCTPPKSLTEQESNWTPSVTPAEDGAITLRSPQRNALLSSPLVVEGEAKWCFFWEGEIDIELVDASGEIVKRWFGKAMGGWTEVGQMVPFRAEIEFVPPSTDVGELVIYSATEVGDRTEYRLPIRFHE